MLNTCKLFLLILFFSYSFAYGEPITVTWDEPEAAGNWDNIDRFEFRTNNAHITNIPAGVARVVICSESDICSTCADAVKFGEVIVDNKDSGVSETGTWPVSATTGFHGTNALYSRDIGATHTSTTSTEGFANEPVVVSLWWTEYHSRCGSVPVKIYDGEILLDTVYINQQTNGSQWNVIGSYTFSNVRVWSGDVILNPSPVQNVFDMRAINKNNDMSLWSNPCYLTLDEDVDDISAPTNFNVTHN